MARYIDADKLLEVLNEELMYECLMFSQEQEKYLRRGLRIAINDVKRFPTEDVVPKSEVEARLKRDGKLIYDLSTQIVDLKEAKAEVAREIFEKLDSYLWWFPQKGEYVLQEDLYDKLKEEYTESEDK